MVSARSRRRRSPRVFISLIVRLYTSSFLTAVRALRGVSATGRSPRRTKSTCASVSVVTRATLKGTVLIGAAPGVLGGWRSGSSARWSDVLGNRHTILSIIRASAGASVGYRRQILVGVGRVCRGRSGLFCGIVVACGHMLDDHGGRNPDARADDFRFHARRAGTFRRDGVISAPPRALFVTVWEMFGVAFRGELADSASVVSVSSNEIREIP